MVPEPTRNPSHSCQASSRDRDREGRGQRQRDMETDLSRFGSPRPVCVKGCTEGRPLQDRSPAGIGQTVPISCWPRHGWPGRASGLGLQQHVCCTCNSSHVNRGESCRYAISIDFFTAISTEFFTTFRNIRAGAHLQFVQTAATRSETHHQ